MIELPDPDSPGTVADWLELRLSVDAERLSKAQVASAIEGLAGKEPTEAFLSSIWRELGFRQGLYSRSFFKVEGNIVERQLDSSGIPEYQACLLLSLYGVIDSTGPSAKLFEKIVRIALKHYLTGDAKILGWPLENGNASDSSGETAIECKVRSLAQDLGERFCEPPAARFKDRGLDVVGWVPFCDKRSGQVVMLVQCAAGHNWKRKLPVPLGAWCEYIHWASNPTTAFAIPGTVNNNQWHDVSKDRGILFDRIRILNLLPGGIEEQALLDEARQWVENELRDLQD